MMKSIKKISVFGFLCICYNLNAQQLAFPGAEGFGKFTTGGRGGIVYHVTKLTDDGTNGTLRYGINLTVARTIVFDVSGYVELISNLTIKNGNITIAGQTAPGDGICIKNYTFSNDADNVIIRYIRFRTGDEATAPGDTTREYDAAWGRNRNNVIIDHCSFSWANDEVCSFYQNANFTLQWCLISESLYLSTHWKGAHGYGGIWGADKGTFHHNLIAHHSSRNPRFSGHRASGLIEDVDFRNNVLYNWGGNSAYGGESGRHNMVNNYYKKGPATKTGVVSYRIVQPSDAIGQFPVYSKWHVSGNYVEGNTTVTNNNWSGGVQPYQTTILIDSFKAVNPYNYEPINTETAVDAFNSVLQKVGCNFPKRDTVDARIIDETKNGTVHFGGAYGTNKGIIDSQTAVGGFPVLNSKQAPVDTDKDGMPDFWENYLGTNINDANDRNGDLDSDGYTNLEEYLNGLVDGTVAQITSIQEKLLKVNKNDIEVYPNPISNNSLIRFYNPKTQKINISIYNVYGKNIFPISNSIFPVGEISIPFSNSSHLTGIYEIHLQMEGYSISKKIVFYPYF